MAEHNLLAPVLTSKMLISQALPEVRVVDKCIHDVVPNLDLINLDQGLLEPHLQCILECEKASASIVA